MCVHLKDYNCRVLFVSLLQEGEPLTQQKKLQSFNALFGYVKINKNQGDLLWLKNKSLSLNGWLGK